MRIGAMSGSFRLPLRLAARKAKQLGITAFQINVAGGAYDVDKMNDKKIAKLQSTLKKYGLEISAFCGDMGGHGFMVEADNAWKIAKSKRMADLAARMGVGVITTHIGVIPEDTTSGQFRVMREALAEIGEYAYGKGVAFAVETGPETAPVLKAFLDTIPRGVGVNLDPANFVMVTRQDPVEAVKLLGKYILHTHAKDGINLRPIKDASEVYGSPDPAVKHKEDPANPVFKEVPLGQGQVRWAEYIAALREVGFDGTLAIERECGSNPVKDIGIAAAFLKPFVGEKPLVYAVVGCGGIANGLHFPAISKLADVKIKYTCDIITERAEKARDKYGIKGYTLAVKDYRDILKDPEVDAVIVCTHTHLHAVIAKEALLAGKHAFSEKPLAMDYAEAVSLAEVARETGKISNIGVVCRFNASVNEVKRRIEAGEIGKVYHVFTSFRSYRRVPGIGGEFTTKSHCGGGALFDIGIHVIDQVMYILGNPKPLTASACTYLEVAKDINAYRTKSFSWTQGIPVEEGKPVCDVEEYATGLVRTEGCSIAVNGGWAQNIDRDEWFIDFLGDKGGIRLGYCASFEMFLYENGRFVTKKPKFKKADQNLDEHLAFRESVLTGRKTRAHVDYVLPTALILDGMYRSAEKGEEVRLS